MCMWYKFLSGWNGVYFFLDDHVVESANMHLFTDATVTAFGGIFDSRWFQREIHEEVRIITQSISMAFCELYPIVMTCVLWGSEWPRKRILIYCDNQSTVHIITKGRSNTAT